MRIRARRKRKPPIAPRITLPVAAMGIAMMNMNSPMAKICIGRVAFFLGADKARELSFSFL